jgi:hypothetical protein
MKSDTCQLLVVDFGSTSIKTARFSVTKDGILKKEEEGEWIDYLPDINHTTGVTPFHLLIPEHLSGLLHTLHTQIIRISPQERTPHNPLLVVSGLTNTLAITHKGKTTLLLDDPSLTPKLTPQEEIIISRTCGRAGLRSASSLMKLLAIKKDTGILSSIFNSQIPIGWNDVTFATALSVVTGYITQTQQRFAIPYDDVRAFGTHTLTPNQTIALLDTLDILPSKFAVAPARTVKTASGPVYQINDFQAEAALVSRLFEIGLIPQTAFVISLDTVGKILTKYLPSKKTIADISYTTLRNSGRVVKTWIKTLIRPLPQVAFYEEMDRILTESPADGGYHFYPAFSDDTEGICIAPDGSVMHFGDIHMIPENNRAQVVVAVARGIGWEMRHMIDECLRANTMTHGTPIILYGGLTGHNQHGWIDTLSFTLPTKHGLFTLPLTNGMLAAAVSALSEIPSLPNASLSFVLTKITDKPNEKTEYTKWCARRPRD